MTKKAAYFSDSQQPVIYRVSRSRHGAPGQVTTIPLTGDYQHVGGGAFNLNGIVATADGKKLIAVQTAAKKLFLIDPRSGATKAIDTGTYDLVNGDGLLLEGTDAVRRPEPLEHDRRLPPLARSGDGDVRDRRSPTPTSTSRRRSTVPASTSTS